MARLVIFCFFLIWASSCRQGDIVNIKTSVIQLRIVATDGGGHKDILFQVSGLTEEKAFDSYFFALAIARTERVDNLPDGVSELFEYWREKTATMQQQEIIFLPIDFADEYTGCLRVERVGDKLNLAYGFTEIRGLDVSPLNPGDFYKEVKDFQPDEGKFITVRQEDFMKSVDTLISKLRDVY